MELLVTGNDGRRRIVETDTEIATNYLRRLSIGRNDPASPRTEVSFRSEFKRADWHACVETTLTITSDHKKFYVMGTLRAFDREKLFAERVFEEAILRDNM
jgi:hypothetical protein